MCATSSQSLYIVPILHAYFLFLFFTAAFLLVSALSLPLTFSISMFLHFSRFDNFGHLLSPFFLVFYLFELLPSSFLSILFSFHHALLLPISPIVHPSVHPFLFLLYRPLSLSLSVSRFPCISFSLCLFVDVGDEEEAGPLCRFQNSRERCKFLAPSISVSVPEDEPYYSDEEYYDHPLFSPEWTLSGSCPSGQAAAFSQIEGEPRMVPLHHLPPFSSFPSLPVRSSILFGHVYPNLGIPFLSLFLSFSLSSSLSLVCHLPSVFCLCCVVHALSVGRSLSLTFFCLCSFLEHLIQSRLAPSPGFHLFCCLSFLKCCLNYNNCHTLTA